MNLPSVGGLVILYNPSSENLSKIEHWHSQCNQFVVIDNSPKKLSSSSLHFLNSENVYLHEPRNIGIAKALNKGCQILWDHGCEWALTLDQDSDPVEGMVKGLLNLFEQQTNQNEVGILSPFHQVSFAEEFPSGGEVDYPDEVMTSGNLVSLRIWEKLKGFDESLFIDCVDTDYCLKLKANGYLTMRANRIGMPHSLGDRTMNTILGRTYYPSHHNPLRRYYMTRNRLEMIRRYKELFPGFTAEIHRNIYREWMMIWLFENAKIRKNLMILKGYWHFYKRRFGKLQ